MVAAETLLGPIRCEPGFFAVLGVGVDAALIPNVVC